jgi:hypothetical protein
MTVKAIGVSRLLGMDGTQVLDPVLPTAPHSLGVVKLDLLAGQNRLLAYPADERRAHVARNLDQARNLLGVCGEFCPGHGQPSSWNFGG